MDKFVMTRRTANTISGPIMVTPSPRATGPLSCAFRKGGNGRLAVSGSPGRVWLWDLDAGRCLASAGLDARIQIDSLALDGSRVWITDTLGARHVLDFSDAVHAQK